jgi:putative DNA methylase
MKMKKKLDTRLIESDAFPFEFLSQVAERESWRKEIHRPIYHVHKWWAKRLGSVFRGILLGSSLGEKAGAAGQIP